MVLTQLSLAQRGFILFALIFFEVTLFTIRPSYGANCDLKQAVETHQRLDNFLEQKFDHVWYGTKPTTNYRAQTLEDITHALPADSAILFYALSTEPDFISPPNPILDRTSPKFLCVWLLDRSLPVTEAEIALDAEAGQELLALADDIRTSLLRDDPSRGWQKPPPSQFVVAMTKPHGPNSDRLPSEVLEEAARMLLPRRIGEAIIVRDYSRLIIVPSRNFGSIPYAALPIDRRLQLIDRVSVVVMPSFGTLVDSATSPPRFGPFHSLVVGDPELNLPGAREEAEAVARALDTRPLLGAAASQKSILPAVLNSDLIYFATHGVANDRDPNDRSYLLLSDGRLTARTIAKLKLRQHPIVVMSACQTGLGKTFESGVIGLAKAWNYAGAASVIMTLWSVYDTPTRDLMVDFIHRLMNGQREDLALQAAMQKLKGNSIYSHPLYWAGFSIYGSPRPNQARRF